MFYIESKLFKFILEEGGRTYELWIFERGKNRMHKVLLGKEGASSLHSMLVEIFSQPLDQQFIKSCMEGVKVMLTG